MRQVSLRKTDCLSDLRAFSSFRCSWSSSWPIRSIQCFFTRRWHSGFRYKMGPSSTICKWSTQGKCLGESVQDAETWVCPAPDRIGNVRTRNWSRSSVAKLSKIEDNGKEIRSSDDQDAQLQSPEWMDWDRCISQKSTSEICQRGKENGLHMDSVQEETLAVLATGIIVDNKNNGPLLLRRRRHRLTEASLRKALAPKDKVLLEGKVRKRLKTSWRNSVQIRRVIDGILPHVNITSLYRDANSAVRVSSGTLRMTFSRAKCLIKVVEKDRLSYWRGLHTWVACCKVKSHRRSLFHGRAEKWNQIAPSNSSRGTWHHKKNQERKGPSQRVVQKCEPQERSPCAPRFEDRSLQETLQQERWAWDLAKSVCKLNNIGPGHVLLPFWSMDSAGTLFEETRGRDFVVDSGASM